MGSNPIPSAIPDSESRVYSSNIAFEETATDMPKYYLWTIGCQMNKAESQLIADCLELAGYQATGVLREANLVILNTCVVRQSAEDKVLGALGYLKGIRNNENHVSVVVTGCFVDSNIEQLGRKFPHVDLFFRPGDFASFLSWAEKEGISVPESTMAALSNDTPTVFIPIVQGCNNFCSYCIVPYRRGRERSRPMEEIICEVSRLAKLGTREVTLLGQNVNSYGHDLLTKPSLVQLLTELNNVEGLSRIRFLTSHPKDMSEQLTIAMASLDRVCEHINLPLQAGDNGVLERMRRGYTVEQYLDLIDNIRSYMPNIAISTDVIVGFPGEDEEQFRCTLDVLEGVRFDTVHVAVYSPRPDTVATKEYADDVPPEIKKERLARVEALHAKIAAEINSRLEGKTVEVLVEGRKDNKWYGRTRSNKLVFFENVDHCLGHLIDVTITKTSAWALQGGIAVSMK